MPPYFGGSLSIEAAFGRVPLISEPKKFRCFNWTIATLIPHSLAVSDSLRLCSRFRCERSDDFFKARVAAQCVPHWIEFEVAVGCAIPGTTRDWIMCSGCELLDSRIFIASVNGDSRSKIGQPAYIECIDLHLINNC